jgi:ABC-2 type transport system ATP-binding protein
LIGYLTPEEYFISLAIYGQNKADIDALLEKYEEF